MRIAMAAAITAGVVLSTGAMAQTESVIWSFDSGSYPNGRVTLDPTTGVLYGTTVAAGNGFGTVFSLSSKHGIWKYTMLYAFAGGADGQNPYAGLSEDSSGALYGTTEAGGSYGEGTLFKLAYNGSSWVHTVLHTFGGGHDGANPYSALLIDEKAGTIYGTTVKGGAHDCGTVFEQAPSGHERVLHSFASSEACDPYSGLREDSSGRLYGASLGSGLQGFGSVYMLQQVQGKWSESMIYRFDGADGEGPNDIDLDRATNTLYGTTTGGHLAAPTVFTLTETNGVWQENTLYTLNQTPVGLHLDAATGNLYGATYTFDSNTDGSVFELTSSGGTWTETNLHNFAGPPGDGDNPTARPTEDPKTGYLYGTTYSGGLYNGGIAYLVVP